MSWGEWGFADLADQYLDGALLEYGDGFPSFLIRGPASNYPPDSRPSSFCEESRGTDPEGEPAYNDRWFEYWAAVSDYLETSGRTGNLIRMSPHPTSPEMGEEIIFQTR